jgi:exonuclease I
MKRTAMQTMYNILVIPKIDAAAYGRRLLARARARNILAEMPNIEERQREDWLADQISATLTTYNQELERLVNHFSKNLSELLNLKATEPFVIKNKADGDAVLEENNDKG